MADWPGSSVSSLGWDAGNPALSFPRCFLEIRETLSCSNPLLHPALAPRVPSVAPLSQTLGGAWRSGPTGASLPPALRGPPRLESSREQRHRSAGDLVLPGKSSCEGRDCSSRVAKWEGARWSMEDRAGGFGLVRRSCMES